MKIKSTPSPRRDAGTFPSKQEFLDAIRHLVSGAASAADENTIAIRLDRDVRMAAYARCSVQRADRDDIVQTVLCELLVQGRLARDPKLKRLAARNGTAKKMLSRIRTHILTRLRLRMIDYARRVQRRAEVELPETFDIAISSERSLLPEKDEVIGFLKNGVNLAHEERALVIQMIEQNLRPTALAAQLDIHWSRIYRAMERVRPSLRSHFERE